MTSSMYVCESRKLSLDELGLVLDNLPRPQFVNVRLYGDFDYTGISYQVKELIPGAMIKSSNLSGTLENPTKETILEIYKRQQTKARSAADNNRREVTLENMQFIDRENKVHIEVTPYKIEVKEHSGCEPSYISELRKGLARTGFPLTIMIDSRTY